MVRKIFTTGVVVAVSLMTATSCTTAPEETIQLLAEERTASDRLPHLPDDGGTAKDLDRDSSHHIIDESGFGYFVVLTDSGRICLYMDSFEHMPANFHYTCIRPGILEEKEGLDSSFSHTTEAGAMDGAGAILLPDDAPDDRIPDGWDRVAPNLALSPEGRDT